MLESKDIDVLIGDIFSNPNHSMKISCHMGVNTLKSFHKQLGDKDFKAWLEGYTIYTNDEGMEFIKSLNIQP